MARLLLVAPPLAPLRWPQLGPLALQAWLRSQGHEVEVLHGTAWLARELGVEVVEPWLAEPGEALAGEERFAASAWRRAPHALLDELAAEIAAGEWDLVGYSVSFDQVAATVALSTRLRGLRPDLPQGLGGARCDGLGAEALLALCPGVDFALRGEGELALQAILEGLDRDVPVPVGVIEGTPLPDLDALPPLDPSSFLEQVPLEPEQIWAVAEASRGCWWAERAGRCRFCALDGERTGHRARSPARFLEELAYLRQAGAQRLALADNLMPRGFVEEVVPHLDLPTFWEVRPDLRPEEVAALARAGVTVQAGIEALSTSLLLRLGKGSTAGRVLRLLLAAREHGLDVRWNLLYGIPGDTEAEWREVLELIPLLHHLQPPAVLSPIRLDRGSPYVEQASEHGITELRPPERWARMVPDPELARASCTWLEGCYPSASLSALSAEIEAEVGDWQRAWSSGAPVLRLSREGSLVDTRACARAPHYRLTESQVRAVCEGGDPAEPAVAWALRQGLAALVDGRALGLAT